MRTLNLGILAHIDAGKTSLTERLLYAAGVIDAIGRVDDGTTQTDSLALERRRGITIRSAVVSFTLGDVTVNLLDTPGHPDFIAEVERVLGVLDGAVLVVSSVEGVQARTRVLMRTLTRLGIPTLVFVNKVDRAGADPDQVLREVSARLTPASVAAATVHAPGTRRARVRAFGAADAPFRADLLELLTERDDALLARYVDDERDVPYDLLRACLASQTRAGRVHPVFFGSAVTGAGIDALVDALPELLPAAEGPSDGPVSGTVFKVERGPAGERIAYARLFSGTVRGRDRLVCADPDGRSTEAKVTAVEVFEEGGFRRGAEATAGRIARLRGLTGVRIGDRLTAAGPGPHGSGPPPSGARGRQFAPPTLETVVTPVRDRDRGALHSALTLLAEQDPLIDLRQDDIRHEVSVSLYGEVQKEVIQATLAEEFGVAVTFRPSTTIHRERLLGTGEAVERLDREQGRGAGPEGNPFLATVGLRVEPAPEGTGVEFRLGIELGSLPLAFIKAVEESVRETLLQGLHGWRIADGVVVLTTSAYAPRQSHAHATFDKAMSSTAGDFRQLTPLVLVAALRRAGTEVLEPVHRFRLEVPAGAFAPVWGLLAGLGARPDTPRLTDARCVLEGDVPAAGLQELERQLPTLTGGEGVLESAFGHYRPVAGAPPSRPRTDLDPLDRKGYLLRVLRRVRAGAGR
ncbi:GTP-binding protein [Streptomyces sp. NPDC005955]|uniref:GTP-binding protein n=1 Tax=Streptomyces sp. NPDC005955 TaxID=3364738 RepID=UPI0036D0984E